MDAKQTVQDFCDLMVQRNADALRDYLTDDAVYQNVGMPAAVGVDAVIANLAAQFAMFPDSYEYVTVNVVAEDQREARGPRESRCRRRRGLRPEGPRVRPT